MRALLLIGALIGGFTTLAQPANAAGVRVFIRHDVTDYATWRKGYDGAEVIRTKGGVTAQSVYQSTDSPNDVTVIHDFKSLGKAKAFVASPDLKAAMDATGVKGPPKVWFTKATPGTSGKPGHVRMFVRHEVVDYAAWRKSYEAFGAAHWKAMGVTGQAVYRSADNPNDLVVTHDFKSADEAKAFAASPDLKSAMQTAGVKGAPDIWITTRARK